MTYKNWLNEWLIHYIKPSAKERTYIRYEQLIRTHIAPKIGNKDVNDLTPIVLQSFVTELLNTGNLKTGKELSANFVNMVISVIVFLITTILSGLSFTKEQKVADKQNI